MYRKNYLFDPKYFSAFFFYKPLKHNLTIRREIKITPVYYRSLCVKEEKYAVDIS